MNIRAILSSFLSLILSLYGTDTRVECCTYQFSHRKSSIVVKTRALLKKSNTWCSSSSVARRSSSETGRQKKMLPKVLFVDHLDKDFRS